ncbi:MAG: 16S rRNA (cytidine1402-2'-O)-methyltransferase [Parcubacteria group bacterium Greene0416_39]|nr:MAG: 16S rRNA (cytidine1402-2'-O)-methyltransferase [Parcubacteria group bacterium Greene0416_39]
MGILYIVATPIGNLEDISLRVLRILKEVDFVLCEDTRVTRKLLSHYEIHTRTLSYHQHSGEKAMSRVFDLLSQGKNIALVSDAGTPGISDPGNELVAFLLGYPPHKKGRKKFFQEIAQSQYPVIFYESPYRILKTLYEICKVLSLVYKGENLPKVVVGRELTKKFETIYRGTINEVLEQLQAGKPRGEFVVVVYQEK